MEIAKIKVNKTIYSITKMEKDALDSKGYTTYTLESGTKIKKELVHHRESNEFTLWGGRGMHKTMTLPSHIELLTPEALPEIKKEEDKQDVKKFIVGLDYETRSICDHNCIFKFQVTKRTQKNIWISERGGESKRRKISIWEGVESIMPYGAYSMAPSLRANKLTAKK